MTVYRYKEYCFRLNRRANCHRIILRWLPGEGMYSLTVPATMTAEEIRRFLDAQEAVIAQHAAAHRWRPCYTAGERHLLWGEYLPLCGGTLPVGETALARFRAEALQREVERLLPLWTQRMGVNVVRVTLREMTSRWGSCTPESGTLRLSLRLALLPKKFTEYVLIHELTHLRHADHSADFYRTMEKFCPDWAALRQEIKAQPVTPLPPA